MVNPTVAAAILMGLFFALIILHLPITFSLCIATGACMIYCKIPLMTLIQNYSASINSFTLMAIPFFVLAGEITERGEKVVLVRLETSPEDITGMKSAQGILTVRGGMTSHAAVVARGMGTCCVSGCGDINMDEENKKFTLAGQTFTEGSEISIDGTTGNIYAGLIPTVDASIAGEFGLRKIGCTYARILSSLKRF